MNITLKYPIPLWHYLFYRFNILYITACSVKSILEQPHESIIDYHGDKKNYDRESSFLKMVQVFPCQRFGDLPFNITYFVFTMHILYLTIKTYFTTNITIFFSHCEFVVNSLLMQLFWDKFNFTIYIQLTLLYISQ